MYIQGEHVRWKTDANSQPDWKVENHRKNKPLKRRKSYSSSAGDDWAGLVFVHLASSRGKKIYDDGLSEPVVVASRRLLEPTAEPEADVVIVKSAIHPGSADNFTLHFHDYCRRCFPSVSHLKKKRHVNLVTQRTRPDACTHIIRTGWFLKQMNGWWSSSRDEILQNSATHNPLPPKAEKLRSQCNVKTP